MEKRAKTKDDLQKELDEARRQLYEANETIEAIRTGQVDALVVQNGTDHQLFTLKTADRAYRVFIEKMSEGAVTVNAEGMILYSNSQFAQMVQLPLSAVIGLPFREFVANENKASYDTFFQKCWADDCKAEVDIYHQGVSTPVQLSLTPLELEEGVSLSIVITDLTSQKATQKKLKENNEQLEHLNKHLEESNHDLQQFASVASHDLQEPLRKIQMFTNTLKQKWHDRIDAEEERYLDKVIGSAKRMKTLIIDVLNYSKLSSNSGEFESTNLNALVKEVLEDFDLLVQEKSASIVVSALPEIDVNRGQMRQVFQNLISNAIKFSKTDRPPVVEISSRKVTQKNFHSPEQSDGSYCFISVKDNGIGFDEKYTPNIFSLFERLHPKDKYEGTGIGLAITKKIVEKHAGMIDVKSAEGEGSEFKIILPVKQFK